MEIKDACRLELFRLEIIFERTFRTPTSGREIEALEGIRDEGRKEGTFSVA